jgi:hypothetical protein
VGFSPCCSRRLRLESRSWYTKWVLKLMIPILLTIVFGVIYVLVRTREVSAVILDSIQLHSGHERRLCAPRLRLVDLSQAGQGWRRGRVTAVDCGENANRPQCILRLTRASPLQTEIKDRFVYGQFLLHASAVLRRSLNARAGSITVASICYTFLASTAAQPFNCLQQVLSRTFHEVSFRTELNTRCCRLGCLSARWKLAHSRQSEPVLLHGRLEGIRWGKFAISSISNSSAACYSFGQFSILMSVLYTLGIPLVFFRILYVGRK